MMFDGAIQLVGTLGFGKVLAQTVYAAAITERGGVTAAAEGEGATVAAALPLERVCYGAACFAGTHLVTASLSAVGALSLGCVGRRSRGLYQRIWTSEERLMRVREEVG
jgi:hypothetical protein